MTPDQTLTLILKQRDQQPQQKRKQFWVEQTLHLLTKLDEMGKDLIKAKSGVNSNDFLLKQADARTNIRLSLAKSYIESGSIFKKDINSDKFEAMYDLVVEVLDATIANVDEREKIWFDEQEEKNKKSAIIIPKMGLIK